jgi:hypothetical protein
MPIDKPPFLSTYRRKIAALLLFLAFGPAVPILVVMAVVKTFEVAWPLLVAAAALLVLLLAYKLISAWWWRD